jgi:putative copper resistance protein D
MPDLADPLTLARLVVKALAYGTSLLAAGLWLFRAAHRVDAETARTAGRLAAAAALAGVSLAGASILGEALFLTAGDWAAAMAPFLLGVVLDTPIGDAQMARAAGLGLIAAAALSPRLWWLGLLGAFAVVASFALVGHSVREPRAALAALVALHVGAAAYWIGAFAPLSRLARLASPAEAGRVAEAFGLGAVWAVGLLVLAGTALGLTFGGDPLAALSTPWGRLLALKLIGVALLLGLAGLNKLQLSPRLMAGDTAAAAALRRSILLEGWLAAAIVAATAAMTTTGAPAAG